MAKSTSAERYKKIELEIKAAMKKEASNDKTKQTIIGRSGRKAHQKRMSGGGRRVKGMEFYEELWQWFVDRINNVKGRVTSEMIIHKAVQKIRCWSGTHGRYPGVMYLLWMCLICLPWS